MGIGHRQRYVIPDRHMTSNRSGKPHSRQQRCRLSEMHHGREVVAHTGSQSIPTPRERVAWGLGQQLCKWLPTPRPQE